ncbi:hypothetical protein CH063_05026 [Colletotrichum higginsianum]|uniref:Uncharacterized protein n=1 Tax=Colletotrichum higginsianum (strain IMI 349063) TaxID=759273 RepID=H1UXJ0_COLHI|nr:hypothetical protein CH63R_09567 [Colletotrichum higginsianum IMI 349063]OBR08046.1 hypothetical protein CH63R_09567 [Colletotrichum higginsianum IMI 349063]CCF32691.1 hypothetical protein CH063_05026 [Colletotrichum higginsianum]
MKQGQYPSCVYSGTEEQWKEECRKQDIVGDSASGQCEKEKGSSSKKKKKKKGKKGGSSSDSSSDSD